MDLTVFQPASVHPTTGYSHAVKVGDLLFVSGQVAKNETGKIVGIGDIRAQTRQVYENLRAVLEAAGSGLELIGKTTIYTTSLDYRSAIFDVRAAIFGPLGYFPASTFVVIDKLADPDFLVEIEAIAALR